MSEERDLGQVKVARVEEAFEGLRADQILTSELFGLSTTRSLRTVQMMEEYSQLLGKATRTGKEEARLQELSARMSSSVPMHGETQKERQAAELIEQLLEKEFQHLPAEKRYKVRARSTKSFS